MVSLALAVMLLALIFFAIPPLTFWRSNLLYAMLLALASLCTMRLLLNRSFGGEAFKRRVLVLGAGQRAARIEALGKKWGTGFTVAGYIGNERRPGRGRRRQPLRDRQSARLCDRSSRQ